MTTVAAKDREPGNDEEIEMTARALLVLMIDVTQLHATTERVRIQVDALARRHGIAAE